VLAGEILTALLLALSGLGLSIEGRPDRIVSLACVAAALLALRRLPAVARGPLLGLAVAWLVERSGALERAWPWLGPDRAAVVPGILLVLGLGTLWAFSRAPAHGAPWLRRAALVVASGLCAWMAVTTAIVGSGGLVRPALNAAALGIWLALVVVWGAVGDTAATSSTVARRIALYVVVLVLVGWLRGL
jgi:hypothetical protein